MHTADIAKSTQCWCERILSGRFSPLRSAPAQMIFFNIRSPLRSRSAHMLWSNCDLNAECMLTEAECARCPTILECFINAAAHA